MAKTNWKNRSTRRMSAPNTPPELDLLPIKSRAPILTDVAVARIGDRFCCVERDLKLWKMEVRKKARSG